MAGSPLTVTALSAMRPGQKLAAGRSIYLRCANNGDITATLRVKRLGRLVDLKVGVYESPFSKATVARILREADALRENADQRIQAAVDAKTEVAPAKLKGGSTLADVWATYRADVVKNKRWSPRNLVTNDARIAKHLATWDKWTVPAASVDADDVARHLAQLADRPAQMEKVRGLLGLVLAKAKRAKIISDGDIIKDARAEMDDSLPQQSRGRNHHALLEFPALRKLYRSMDQLAGSPHVRNALRLQALTAQRTGEVIGAQWREFDLDAEVPTWTIPRWRMKVKTDSKGNPRPDQVLHLSSQAVLLVKQMRDAAGTVDADAYVFPGRPGEDRRVGHVTDNAISQAMRRDLRMQGLHVPHGWRAALKTLCTAAEDGDGRPLFADAWSECVLDHVAGDAIQQAYQRGRLYAQAGRVLAWWADQLTQEAAS